MSVRGGADIEALEMDVAEGARRLWWIPLITGIIWIFASLVVLRFDLTSVKGVGIIAGVVFLVAGVQNLLTAPLLSGAWRWFVVLLGVILVAGGIYAFVNPVETFVAIASLVGWLLLIVGVFDITLALTNRHVDLWWLRLALGILELILALVVSGNLQEKAIFLIVFVGAAAMVRGVTDVVLAFQMRSIGTRA